MSYTSTPTVLSVFPFTIGIATRLVQRRHQLAREQRSEHRHRAVARKRSPGDHRGIPAIMTQIGTNVNSSLPIAMLLNPARRTGLVGDVESRGSVLRSVLVGWSLVFQPMTVQRLVFYRVGSLDLESTTKGHRLRTAYCKRLRGECRLELR